MMMMMMMMMMMFFGSFLVMCWILSPVPKPMTMHRCGRVPEPRPWMSSEI